MRVGQSVAVSKARETILHKHFKSRLKHYFSDVRKVRKIISREQRIKEVDIIITGFQKLIDNSEIDTHLVKRIEALCNLYRETERDFKMKRDAYIRANIPGFVKSKIDQLRILLDEMTDEEGVIQSSLADFEMGYIKTEDDYRKASVEYEDIKSRIISEEDRGLCRASYRFAMNRALCQVRIDRFFYFGIEAYTIQGRLSLSYGLVRAVIELSIEDASTLVDLLSAEEAFEAVVFLIDHKGVDIHIALDSACKIGSIALIQGLNKRYSINPRLIIERYRRYHSNLDAISPLIQEFERSIMYDILTLHQKMMQSALHSHCNTKQYHLLKKQQGDLDSDERLSDRSIAVNLVVEAEDAYNSAASTREYWCLEMAELGSSHVVGLLRTEFKLGKSGSDLSILFHILRVNVADIEGEISGYFSDVFNDCYPPKAKLTVKEKIDYVREKSTRGYGENLHPLIAHCIIIQPYFFYQQMKSILVIFASSLFNIIHELHSSSLSGIIHVDDYVMVMRNLITVFEEGKEKGCYQKRVLTTFIGKSCRDALAVGDAQGSSQHGQSELSSRDAGRGKIALFQLGNEKASAQAHVIAELKLRSKSESIVP